MNIEFTPELLEALAMRPQSAGRPGWQRDLSLAELQAIDLAVSAHVLEGMFGDLNVKRRKA